MDVDKIGVTFFFSHWHLMALFLRYVIVLDICNKGAIQEYHYMTTSMHFVIFLLSLGQRILGLCCCNL